MAQQTIYFYSSSDFSFVIQGVYDDTAPLPANSTTVSPGETVAQHVYVWHSDVSQWVSTIDLRGTRIYNQADGTEGAKIMAIGQDIPEGYTDQQPPDYPNYPTIYDYHTNTTSWVLDANKQTQQQAAAARINRSALLGGSDWMVGPDAPITTAALQSFAEYRQRLRDLPAQAGFPANINWPAAPAYAKSATLDSPATKAAAIQAGYNAATQGT